MSDAMASARAMWSAGDWPELSRMVRAVGERTVERAGVGPGQQVLDVGAGDGNVAIPAAAAGARVIALDPTPELFESGRARAAEAGVDVEWVEGEAMDLPYEDGRFDAVLSNFGAMFAPVNARTAAELARVCRPAGTIAMTTWAREHMNGRFLAAGAPFMPPPPEGVESPLLWGDEEHVRACFAPTCRSVTIERDTAPVEWSSLDGYVEFMTTVLGPIALHRPRLEREGRFDDLRTAVRGVFADYNEATDGAFRAAPEYLAIAVR